MDIHSTGPLADDSDRATALELEFTENALQLARERSAPERHPEFDGTHCVECGEQIQAQRLAAGRVRCTDCQSELEQRIRQLGRRA